MQDYIHRVGRTARAGRSGLAVNFVTQYDVEVFQRIEKLIGVKMELHPHEESEVGSIGSAFWQICIITSLSIYFRHGYKVAF